jgi:hypothetical protein
MTCESRQENIETRVLKRLFSFAFSTDKHIPIFVMFCLHAVRVQPLSADRRTVTVALSPINTDLAVLTEAGNDIQRLRQQYDLDEAEALIANGWVA